MTPLETHIHQSLLHSTCTDTNLRIPQWRLEYATHRVILAQAGFFEGLFCGGFEEEGRGRFVEVGFGDGNIGRAGFE
jgi:hypothetical protein